MNNNKVYAVKRGHQIGIFNTWAECRQATDGFEKPYFRKFYSVEDAENFLNSSYSGTNNYNKQSKTTSKSLMSSVLSKFKNIKAYPFGTDIPYTIDDWNTYNNEFYIFTDGSHRKGKSNVEDNSGIGVYFGKKCNNIKEIYTDMTNNQCELKAIDYCFKVILKYHRFIINKNMPINIVSDSDYSIKACSLWIKKWKENNWMTSNNEPVKNKDIISSIDNSMDKIKIINSKLSDNLKMKVKFVHIKSHQSPENLEEYPKFIWLGNFIADALAQNKL